MVRGATPDVVLTGVELLARGLDDERPGLALREALVPGQDLRRDQGGDLLDLKGEVRSRALPARDEHAPNERPSKEEQDADDRRHETEPREARLRLPAHPDALDGEPAVGAP